MEQQTNPILSALGHGAETPADALSDYIPQSNEVSRVPSTAGDSVEPKQEEEEEDEVIDDDEEEEAESDGDAVMKQEVGAGGKKLNAKKEAKKKLDDKVSFHSLDILSSTSLSITSGAGIEPAWLLTTLYVCCQ